MPVGTKLVPVEMHKYHGPCPLRKDGEHAQRVARGFWDAFKAWEDGGKLVTDDGVCVMPKAATCST